MLNTQVDSNLCKTISYVENLIKDLLESSHEYFSKGYLNSEGWKKIGVIVKVLSNKRIQVTRFVNKIRDNPEYENTAKVLSDLLQHLYSIEQSCKTSLSKCFEIPDS